MDQYNINNIEITKENIIDILNKYNINNEPKNMKYYNISLTHRSFVKEHDYSFIDILNKEKKEEMIKFRNVSNERYEFLGDILLSSIIAEYLFFRFPNENEGVLTRIKTIIISCRYFYKFAKKINFGKYIVISNNMEYVFNARDLDNVLEDAFEAFICALYIDLGKEVIEKFIIGIIEENVNFSKLLFNNDNYKDRLTKISQKDKLLLQFKNNTIIGPSNKRTYILSLFINNKDTGLIGFGNTKRDAEHDVSLKYLLKNKYINEEEQKIILS